MKNIHLLISTLIVIPAAIFYGFYSELLFDIHPANINEHNVYKGIMGLYLAFSFLWIVGILNPNLWKVATISNILFMFGLVFGRIISLLMDGFPSALFLFGTLGEVILGSYAYYWLKKDIT